MGNPYLKSDESIILTTHRVLISSVLSDMILTSQRLILSDSLHTEFKPHSIYLGFIKTVKAETGAAGEPVLSISVLSPDNTGAITPMEIVFEQAPRENRAQECREWVIKLKEQTSYAPQPPEPEITVKDLFGSGVLKEEEKTELGLAPETAQTGMEKPTTEPVVTVFPFSGPKKSGTGEVQTPEPTLPEKPAGEGEKYMPMKPPVNIPPPRNRIPLTAIVVCIVVILALFSGAYIYLIWLPGQQAPPAPTVPTPEPAEISPSLTTPVPSPEPTDTIEPEISTAPAAPPIDNVPSEGVWVRIRYSGAFTGTYGTAGRIRDVAGSGEQFYRAPTNDGIVDTIIQKEDSSGGKLTVGIYKNGVLVKEASTTAPKGTIDLHVSVKDA